MAPETLKVSFFVFVRHLAPGEHTFIWKNGYPNPSIWLTHDYITIIFRTQMAIHGHLNFQTQLYGSAVDPAAHTVKESSSCMVLHHLCLVGQTSQIQSFRRCVSPVFFHAWARHPAVFCSYAALLRRNTIRTSEFSFGPTRTGIAVWPRDGIWGDVWPTATANCFVASYNARQACICQGMSLLPFGDGEQWSMGWLPRDSLVRPP